MTIRIHSIILEDDGQTSDNDLQLKVGMVMEAVRTLPITDCISVDTRFGYPNPETGKRKIQLEFIGSRGGVINDTKT